VWRVLKILKSNEITRKIFGIQVVLMFILVGNLLYSAPTQPKDDIQAHLKKVEQSLTSIRTLEKDLEAMRKDIISIEDEKAKIEQQLLDARALQTVTQEQIQAIRHEINPPKSTKDSLIGILSGFIGGIASSIIAAYVFNWFIERKQKKQQANKLMEGTR
jgi:septal ring factor EnvC (AmiA/AmiB activator)